MKIIGVTGSSGAGKTELCKMIVKEYDAEIIDADSIAKQLSKKGSLYLKTIIDSFGEDIVYKNGALNRRKLANIIYEDDSKRELLNSCTFDYIVSEIKEKIGDFNYKQIILIDAPLLFESGLDSICDFVVAVLANRENQIDRICKRDNITIEDAVKRLNAQSTDEFFKEEADILIENNKTLEDLEKQIKKIKI